MRDHSKHIQVDKEEAVATILQNCLFEPLKETVPVAEAAGRILAEDMYAQWESPNCLTCRMDSVAVHWKDFENGMPDTSEWERGKQWEFANTGVAMPEGFDTAIVVEHVLFSEDEKTISFNALPSGPYAGTSAKGSKLQKGDLLVRKGTYLTPLLTAYLASGNNAEIPVLKKPVVAFLPTGNELVKPGGNIPTGKNIESNSFMIAGKITQWGGTPLIRDIVADEKEALKKALQETCEAADIVILNAGSSKGSDDWGIEMLEEIGTVFYHQTSHGPGHHSSFGMIGTTPVIGISGPPGGAAFTTDYYLYPAMMKYLGKDPSLTRVKVRLAEGFAGSRQKKSSPEGRTAKGEERPKEGGKFYTVRQMILQQAEDGILEARPLKNAHPEPLEAEMSDAYYLMPSFDGNTSPEKGEMIEVELRPEYTVNRIEKHID